MDLLACIRRDNIFDDLYTVLGVSWIKLDVLNVKTRDLNFNSIIVNEIPHVSLMIDGSIGKHALHDVIIIIFTLLVFL